MFQNILFPFDGTARCLLATPEIVQLVKVNKAQLRVLYVNRGVALDILTLQDLQTEIGRLLGSDETIPEPSYHMAEGRPDEEIVRFARDHEIDLIAIPTRGLSRLRRMFTGSTTELVVRRSACPVWTLTDTRRHSSNSGRIVCGISHTRDAASLVREAESLRHHPADELTLVYAVPELNEGTLARMSQDPPFLSVPAARRYLHTLAQSTGVSADCQAEVGSEAKVYARVAEKVEADLLVVDQSKHSVALNVATLARHAGCPVLITNAAFSRERLRRTLVERDVSFAGAARVTGRRKSAAG